MNNLFLQVNKSKYIFLLIVLGVVAAYMAGMKSGERKQGSDTSRILTEARKYFQPIPDFKSISGRVLEIKGDKIFLEAFIQQNPFDSVPSRRVILISRNTIVVKIINKNSLSYEKEVEEYQNRLRASAGQSVGVIPPSLTEEKKVTSEEIKEGDIILVDAGTPIKLKSEFEAVKIVLQSSGGEVNNE